MADDKVNSQLFAYPTDTVWGIGGNIYSFEAVRDLQQVKGVSDSKPHSILFDSISGIRLQFNLPDHLTADNLEKLFGLESTVGFPLTWAREEIPSWITAGSSWVAVRCLRTKAVGEVVHRSGGPVITTSLNRTGEAPAANVNDARKFVALSSLPIQLVDQFEECGSGSPSSIVRMVETGGLEVIRSGRNLNDILQLLDEAAF